ALMQGQAMGIFPEGKSHDAAYVDEVRSGAARIAVQAAEGGSQGLQVICLGLNYERKERFRSAVWIHIGEPIDIDAWIARHEGQSRPAMRALTTELACRL